MKAIPQPQTIAAFCQALKDGSITVNTTYQRGKVWGGPARSSLIETILLGYPIPKLFLHQITDLKTRRVRMEIVDGQQRSTAIADFLDGNLAISKTADERVRGKTFEQLDDEMKNEFLTYQLSIDVFPTGDLREVREAFRRINSHTATLNAEEKRHSDYQGAFKWYIHGLCGRYADVLLGIGCLTEKTLARMGDAKLLTELVFSLLNGIQTTKPSHLNALYAKFEKDFPELDRVDKQVTYAFSQLAEYQEIFRSELVKPYNLHLLLLAFAHDRYGIPQLESIVPPKRSRAAKTQVLIGLSALMEALEEDKPSPELAEFARASEQGTNVEAARKVRFIWFCKAVRGEL